MNELTVNKSLGSPGWYRFAKRNVPNEVSAKYAGGEVLTIKIVRAFNNAQNEAYDISCTLSFEKYSYKLLNSSVKSGLITKIREVYYPDDGLCYLEIYYNGTSINDVKIFLRATKNHYEAVRLEPSVGTPTEILNFNIESIKPQLIRAIGVNQKVTLQLEEYSIYLFGTTSNIVNARSFAAVFGGNTSQVNNTQKATMHNIVTGSDIEYAISNESGKFNQITITNKSVVVTYLSVTNLSGSAPQVVV